MKPTPAYRASATTGGGDEERICERAEERKKEGRMEGEQSGAADCNRGSPSRVQGSTMERKKGLAEGREGVQPESSLQN